MKSTLLSLLILSFSAYAGKADNVEYITIAPAEYSKIGLMPGYGPVSEEGTQYIKLVVSQNDGMGAMSSVRLFLYDEKKELQLISQIYYQCAQEHNKCFIEFNIKPSQLKNLEVELYYLSEGESPKIREYRVQGLGMLTNRSSGTPQSGAP